MSNRGKRLCRLVSAGLLAVPAASFAQDAPVPGVVSGTVDGEAFSIPLDCGAWNNPQRQAFSAGDDRRMSDENGDGYVFNFDHVAMIGMTSGTLIVDGRELGIGPGLRPKPDDPKWEVTDTTASFAGTSLGFDKAEIEVTVDCAPREAAERGFTGRVTGSIAGVDVDEPLFCDNWNGPDGRGAFTPDEAQTAVKLFIFGGGEQGTLEVEAAGESYQIVVAPITGLTFDQTDTTVALVADLKQRGTGNPYGVDLTMDCGGPS